KIFADRVLQNSMRIIKTAPSEFAIGNQRQDTLGGEPFVVVRAGAAGAEEGIDDAGARHACAATQGECRLGRIDGADKSCAAAVGQTGVGRQTVVGEIRSDAGAIDDPAARESSFYAADVQIQAGAGGEVNETAPADRNVARH